MKNFRKYGALPYSIVLIHGGPGAAGEMKPVAEKLSADFGVLEPLQTGTSVTAQVEELKTTLEHNATPPVILIGYSWGAMLSLMVAAKYPQLVKKLILIGSAPLESHYAKNISQTRLDRLGAESRKEIADLSTIFEDPGISELEKNKIFEKIGLLFHKSDSYAPIDIQQNDLDLNIDRHIYETVWPEASKMRESGQFLKLAKMIQCPVVVIHGDYDPHPFEGIKEPLEKMVKDIKCVLLEKCGHTPWTEKYAKDKFYGILKKELTQP